MSYLVGDAMTGGYGSGADILHGCTIAVDKGEIAVIVGPNGAGKSTAMKAIFGMLRLRQGQVRLDGQEITALSPQERVRAGMGFVPQVANVFTSMTVEENLEMGAFIREDEFHDTMEQVFALFPILREKRRQPAGELSGGQRQQVAVARSLLGEPKVVMLDEPTAALGVPQTKQVLALIRRLRERGLGVVVISHNLVDVFEVADRIFVLRLGRPAGDFEANATTEEHVVGAITGVGDGRGYGEVKPKGGDLNAEDPKAEGGEPR